MTTIPIPKTGLFLPINATEAQFAGAWALLVALGIVGITLFLSGDFLRDSSAARRSKRIRHFGFVMQWIGGSILALMLLGVVYELFYLFFSSL